MLLVADEVQIRHGPHRQDVRRRALGRRAGHHLPGQGHRQRHAAGRDHRPRRRHGLAAGSHASTFGGNPVSCRAALATLDLLEGEYIANAAARGEQLRAGLQNLQHRFPEVGAIRGLGLMTAMDVVKSKGTGVTDPVLRDEIVQAAFHHGLLLLGCGEGAVRFCPPLCITAAQVDTALAILTTVLAERKPAKITA